MAVIEALCWWSFPSRPPWSQIPIKCLSLYRATLIYLPSTAAPFLSVIESFLECPDMENMVSYWQLHVAFSFTCNFLENFVYHARLSLWSIFKRSLIKRSHWSQAHRQAWCWSNTGPALWTRDFPNTFGWMSSSPFWSCHGNQSTCQLPFYALLASENWTTDISRYPMKK